MCYISWNPKHPCPCRQPGLLFWFGLVRLTAHKVTPWPGSVKEYTQSSERLKAEECRASNARERHIWARSGGTTAGMISGTMKNWEETIKPPVGHLKRTKGKPEPCLRADWSGEMMIWTPCIYFSGCWLQVQVARANTNTINPGVPE